MNAAVTPRQRRPATTDATRWGPCLRKLWVADLDLYVQEAQVARSMLVDAPHGSFARISRWAMEGRDPGEPACTCGCVGCRTPAEA